MGAPRGQSIVTTYWAWNTNSNAYQTGDVGNHTLRYLLDGAETTPANSPAEVDSTNAPGLYAIALTSAEATHNTVDVAGKSSTSNVVLIGKTYLFDNVPIFAPGSNQGLVTLGSGVGGITVASGFVSSNLQQWEGLPPLALSAGLVQATATITGVTSTAQFGVNVVTWTGAPPNVLQNGLVQVSVMSGAISSVTGSVGSVTGAVGSVTGSVGGNVVGSVGSVAGSVASVTSGVNVTQWLGSPPSALVAGLVQSDVVQIAGIATSTSFAAGNVNLVQWQGTGPLALDAAGHVLVSVVSGVISSVLGNVAGNVLGSVNSVATAVTANVTQVQGATINTLISGRVDVNVGQHQPNSISTSAFVPGTLTTTVFAAPFLTSASFDATYGNALADDLGNRANAIETGLTPYQSWRLVAASQAGVTSGAASPGFNILGVGVSNLRISAVTDQSGNRLSVTVSP